MRVLHVLHNSLPALNGYSIRSSCIIENQKNLGIEVRVVTSARHPNGPQLNEVINGTIYRRTPELVGVQPPLIREWRLMRALRKTVDTAIAEFKPHIVHAHSPVLVGRPALNAARAAGLPFVYEIRDLWENASVDRGKFSDGSLRYRIARACESGVIKSADHVVTICEELRKEVAPRAASPEIVSVVPNGVEIGQFNPAPADPELQASLGLQGKQIIGYIGTFQPYEGIANLIRAMPQITGEVPAAHLLITGEDEQLAALRQLAREPEFKDCITFAGRVPHDRVRPMLALADIMVYPRILTKVTALTTPLKPLEAMAMERAVIVSDVPAMQELVENGKTGLVFRAAEPADLAAKCVRLLNDGQLRQTLGENARRYVLEERAWLQLVSRYEPVYRRLAGAKA
ncbi:MAG: glycosyltransferase [Gammaproteobacteria bacterium]|nr:glycosyltransferase [Gammaproteobacteria bacterium]MDP6617346.1 glycosyltransferase [Gammaproteobacteria bacterium]MDP6694933.1 glycosyltransferase [Gammaproteobacteria bacterium]